ncbi:M23 family metallopeptidase [Mumia quercus]|uniref:M23 family metallopeptidase n=1 Tax=Mumia quercus TaxID=2976125 RepID=UPI0021D10626|nr:M23 family metallopeptidase [Mumia quercus]
MTPVVLDLPFTGRWLVQNSPARRVPSHGTTLMGTAYAIDFVGVDDHGRTAPVRDWRTFLATEPPGRFFAYGRPVHAPCDGTVVAVHDGEPDHEARRSQLALVPYALGQASRVRLGPAAIAGNHVTLAYEGFFVTLVHLRRGSLRVAVGDRIRTGEQLGECGNSGNSTQPHVHVQVTDGADVATAQGVPLAFRDYREWPRGGAGSTDHAEGVPAEGAVVSPLPR